MILFAIKKHIPLAVTSGISSLTTGLIVGTQNKTPDEVYELKTNSEIPKGTPATGSIPKPEEMKDWEFILYKLGAPDKNVAISKGLSVDYILSNVYKKIYNNGNVVFLRYKIDRRWQDIIKEKPHLKDKTKENERIWNLHAECNATKNRHVGGDYFQKQLNFAVEYCIWEAPEDEK